MQDQSKVEQIRGLLQNLTVTNEDYGDRKMGTYFDYDQVLQQLQQAAELMQHSAHTPRPANLPENVAWSETFADPGEEFDPYSYDGSMSPKDYEKMVTAFEADREAGIVDEHGKPTGGDTRIRYYDVHGRFVAHTLPFAEENLLPQMKMATTKVNTDPQLAGWTAFSYDRVFHIWGGRRGDHMAHDAIHVPPEIQPPSVMP